MHIVLAITLGEVLGDVLSWLDDAGYTPFIYAALVISIAFLVIWKVTSRND